MRKYFVKNKSLTGSPVQLDHLSENQRSFFCRAGLHSLLEPARSMYQSVTISYFVGYRIQTGPLTWEPCCGGVTAPWKFGFRG